MLAPDPIFVRPATVEEALRELAQPGAMALGGGTSVAMLLKHRLIEPTTLVYLGGLDRLSGVIEGDGGELRLGATATLRSLIASPEVVKTAPALADAARHVGNARVRAVATIGGALVHADPRQDLPPVLLALGASVQLASAGGARTVPLSEFFRGFMETAAAEDELLTEAIIPPGRNRRTTYARYTPTSQDDYPTVGVAVSLEFDDDGTVGSASVALGGVADRPILVPEAHQLLAGRRPSERDLASLAEAAEAAASPTDDQRGSAAYKKAMAAVWTRRAASACLNGSR